MTDPTPTPTRAGYSVHVEDYADMLRSLSAEIQALRERAEAAERERDGAVQWRNHYRQSWLDCRDALTAARRAEAAAWNDAIEAAAGEVESLWAFRTCQEVADAIRALRRAAPTEDR